MDEVAAQTTRLLLRRLGYFLALIAFVGTLDRVNVSFAAITMNHEIGLDPKAYGFGVGLFFVSYTLFQMPAVALSERWGQVRTLAFMTMSWGLLSAAMGLVGGARSFYALRFLLGLIEAGSSPIVFLYISRWVPSASTARFISRTALALPASFILGAPLSGWLTTSLQGAGALSGWRWMFLIEGGATIILGALAFRVLPESPAKARWLNETQRAWLHAALKQDSRIDVHRPTDSWSKLLGLTLRDPLVWGLAATIFLTTLGFNAFLYWLPQVVKILSPGASNFTVILLSAVPWLSGAIGMLVVGRRSDLKQERHAHVGGSALVAAAGLALAAWSADPRLAFVGLVLAGFGVGGAQGLFFSIPVDAFRGAPNAGLALAFVNMIANLAGLLGSNAIGYLRSATGSFVSSILLLSVGYVLATAVILVVKYTTARHDR